DGARPCRWGCQTIPSRWHCRRPPRGGRRRRARSGETSGAGYSGMLPGKLQRMVIPATERGSKGYSTDQVVSADEAERIRTSLYQAGDAAARGLVLEALPERLSAEDVQFFASHGYLAANGLLTPDEVQQCK